MRPSSAARYPASERVTSGSNRDDSRIIYTGAVREKRRMLWMNEMKVQLKIWNTQAGTCLRMMALCANI